MRWNLILKTSTDTQKIKDLFIHKVHDGCPGLSMIVKTLSLDKAWDLSNKPVSCAVTLMHLSCHQALLSEILKIQMFIRCFLSVALIK